MKQIPLSGGTASALGAKSVKFQHSPRHRPKPTTPQPVLLDRAEAILPNPDTASPADRRGIPASGEPFERSASFTGAQVAAADRGRIGCPAIGPGQVDQVGLALAEVKGAGGPRLHSEPGRNTSLPGPARVQRRYRTTLRFEVSLHGEHLREHDDVGRPVGTLGRGRPGAAARLGLCSHELDCEREEEGRTSAYDPRDGTPPARGTQSRRA